MNENFIREEENRNDSPELDNVQTEDAPANEQATERIQRKQPWQFIYEQLLLIQEASQKASPAELTRLSIAMERLLSLNWFC